MTNKERIAEGKEIIRCKNCKHAGEHSPFGAMFSAMSNCIYSCFDPAEDFLPKEDFFCADGEEKD